MISELINLNSLQPFELMYAVSVLTSARIFIHSFNLSVGLLLRLIVHSSFICAFSFLGLSLNSFPLGFAAFSFGQILFLFRLLFFFSWLVFCGNNYDFSYLEVGRSMARRAGECTDHPEFGTCLL